MILLHIGHFSILRRAIFKHCVQYICPQRVDIGFILEGSYLQHMRQVKTIKISFLELLIVSSILLILSRLVISIGPTPLCIFNWYFFRTNLTLINLFKKIKFINVENR